MCEIYRGVPDVKLHLLRSLLEGSGISMHVQTIGMGPWTELGGLSAVTGMPSELNAARILVRRQDVERAEALLRAAESGALSLRAEGPGDRGGPPPAEP